MHGRYCHICGQENIEPRETFWHMLTHFVFDLFHFDGKFFSTLKYLLLKPGFLSKEHLKGRRADYLHPIRMYVFTSAFFFLLFFTFFSNNEELVELDTSNTTVAGVITKLEKHKSRYEELLRDSAAGKPERFSDSLHSLISQTDSDLVIVRRDTLMKTRLRSLTKDRMNGISFVSDREGYRSLAEYDSVQHSLIPAKRDGFIIKTFNRKLLQLNEKYQWDDKAVMGAILEKFLHSIPSILFTSLPLFAAVLFIMYARRKQYYYSDHLVYTLHLYCAIFILLMISMTLTALLALFSTSLSALFSGLFNILLFYYSYKAMRNFYHQGRKKTVAKFILLLLINLIIFIFLFLVFILFSVMTIH